MVSGWNIKQVVKKKFVPSSKDKKDWMSFTQNMENISAKEIDQIQEIGRSNKIPKIDLHGLTLEQANNKVKKFIITYYNKGYKKILVVTGKGKRNKSYNNPYVSEKLSILKYSIPEHIQNNEDLISKISSIKQANLKDGGEGAIYIFLKNTKKL